MQYIHVENHQNAQLKTADVLPPTKKQLFDFARCSHFFFYLAVENKTTAAPGLINQQFDTLLCSGTAGLVYSLISNMDLCIHAECRIVIWP